MYKKIYFIFVTILILLGSFSMTFSSTNVDEIQISNIQAMAICTAINDLEKWYYKTYPKSVKNDFLEYLNKSYDIIKILNVPDGIGVSFYNSKPLQEGGDKIYIIDKVDYHIIRRGFFQ